MDIPIFDRIFSFFSEARQREKLLNMLRQYFFDNPMAISAVILAGIALIFSLFTGRLSERGRRRADWLCFFGYFLALVLFLVFSRYWQGDVRGIRFFEIDYYMTEEGFHEGNVMITAVNVLIFVPFGCLLRKAAVSWRRGLRRRFGDGAGIMGAFFRLLITLLAGVSIETLQYVFARGYSALLDVTAYAAGSILGMLVTGIILLISGRFHRKREERGR